MARLTKLDRLSVEERKALVEDFRNSPDDGLFTPEAVSLACGFSISWLQKKRCEGGGIPFSKPTVRTILYKKQDVLDYVNNHRMLHTA
ncbi:DNA-binding protein [Acinetobacter sp. BSP-153]|uniref:DNA-binding protein n=1 Tax=Acinetobacter sp. BSP-153 TaxID=3344663 RepID=UPI00376FBDCC